MFRGRGKAGGRGRGAQKVLLKGRFIDGVWHCNCEPRLPAEKFQTKNGGSNHGRWFYTCQKPKHAPARCGFFLWRDEAEPREVKAVLSNSRSEPMSAPQTPTKAPGTRYRASSPSGRSRTASPDSLTLQTCYAAQRSWSTAADSGQDSFEWPSSDEDDESFKAELFKVADRAEMAPPETPRKAVKTDLFSSPGKRRYETEHSIDPFPTPTTDDVFTTPTSGMRGKDLFSTASAVGLLSPADTPTPNRFKEATIGGHADEPELVKDVINTLHNNHVQMDSTATEAVKAVLNRHALKAQGIAKGRDISRLAIKSKDAKIEELQARIAALEAERETHKAVIRHVRRDMEMGRKR